MSTNPYLEMLLSLFLSVNGWTGATLAIVTITTCPDGRVSCPGYQDDYENKYCCPSPGWVQPGGYYCCNYKEKEMYNGDRYENIPKIIGGVVGAAFVVASIVVLSCFFCRRCYIYKYRHRKRNAAESSTQRSNSSTLGWRYRNWPRPSSFVPPMSHCNGTASTSSRYYYSSRPFREAPVYNRHRYRRSMAYSPPRNRHSSRLHSYYTGSGDSRYPLDDGDSFNYGIRSPSTCNPYLCEHILGEAKPFEAPPPYPVAHQYPTCPPVPAPDTPLSTGFPTASPISPSASAGTTSTVLQDDLPAPITVKTSDPAELCSAAPVERTANSNGHSCRNVQRSE